MEGVKGLSKPVNPVGSVQSILMGYNIKRICGVTDLRATKLTSGRENVNTWLRGAWLENGNKNKDLSHDSGKCQRTFD